MMRSLRVLASCLSLLLGLSGLVVVGAQGPALACPKNTVFSAYNGSGLCLRRGGGATDIVVRCSVTVGNYCPKGTKLHHKSSDPDNNYCCQTKTYAATFNACAEQCKPLLTAVQPPSEAERVYCNCEQLCRGSNKMQCPPSQDGQTHYVENGKKCPA